MDTSPEEPPHRAASDGRARLSPELRREVAALWEELECALPAATGCRRCGECCDFPRSGHRLYAEEAEALFALEAATSWRDGNLARGLCPFHADGACTNRSGRPLGCRTYFCGGVDGGDHIKAPVTPVAPSASSASSERLRCEELHEQFLRRLRECVARQGKKCRYRPFLDALRDLGAP